VTPVLVPRAGSRPAAARSSLLDAPLPGLDADLSAESDAPPQIRFAAPVEVDTQGETEALKHEPDRAMPSQAAVAHTPAGSPEADSDDETSEPNMEAEEDVIRPAQFAPRMKATGDPTTVDGGREPFPPKIQLEIPGPEVLFRLESEDALLQRMTQEARQRKKIISFPDTALYLGEPLVAGPRPWQPLAEIVEPSYLPFRRLYFQEINAQRYGWDHGWIHPVVSAGIFYFQFLTLPWQLVAEPRRCYEYNSGWGLPGDPVPFAIYPPHPK
jgi:hypothetical protein